ncbi:phage protein NinX family protein [Thalassotalea piscium]|uniref:DUF2591 domain-containing protein n=1 Tax=Thalassotalea piscium TaxID=1230533 RepID=A0A7X0NGP0_9GAMM|nr:phage protein NinX family protein [Thalassotalea piscium]MBB6543132.1 hypothetical protein [Thalassotalea piscium]
MKTINVETRNLNSNAIDWAIATIKGFPIKYDPMGFKTGTQAGFWIWDEAINGKMLLIGENYSPSTSWTDGGVIIENEGISLIKFDGWIAKTVDGIEAVGETPLVAAMRAYIVTNLGESTEVPEYLL